MTRRVALFVLALVLVAAAWELYKAVGPEAGGDILGWKVLPKTSRNAMPHVWDMGSRLLDPESRSSDRQIWRVVLAGVWFSFRVALVGFVVGALVGVGLAILMARVAVARRGLLPYLVASQTVPLIALAPIVVSWSGKVKPFGQDLPRWLAVSILGAFLAFFPVALGTLRGLTSTPPTAIELMNSYAATWRQSLWRVRFPAAVPQMVPAFRLAASASVVGVVVAEISTGVRGGIGRLVIEYGRQATSDPEKVYAAVFGAALLGLLMTGLVVAVESIVMRNRAPLADEDKAVLGSSNVRTAS
jgi:NitT/TauT family transport system permease protein